MEPDDGVCAEEDHTEQREAAMKQSMPRLTSTGGIPIRRADLRITEDSARLQEEDVGTTTT